MKRLIIYAVVLLLSLPITACVAQTEESETWTNQEIFISSLKTQHTLSECMDKFPYVAVVKPIEKPSVSENGSMKLQLEIYALIQGDIPDLQITLEVHDTELDYSCERYLVFLERFENVMSGTTTYVADEIIYEADNSLYCDSITDIADLSLEETIALAKAYAVEHPFQGEAITVGEYIKSSDLNDIYEGSDSVFSAIVRGIEYDDVPDRTTVLIEITEVYKGDVSGISGVIVPKRSVEIDQEYVFFVNKPDETARYFIVSSRHSIYKQDEVEGFLASKKQ